MVRYILTIAALLVVVPLNVYTQEFAYPEIQYEVPGDWRYVDVWWNPVDTIHTGMRYEFDSLRGDTVLRFQSYGSTIDIPDKWTLHTSFGKFNLPDGPYPWPDEVLCDVSIHGFVNLDDFDLSLSLLDTTGGGGVTSMYTGALLVPDWQTIRWMPNPWDKSISALGIDHILLTADSGYTGIELWKNDLRFVYYKTGDTIIVDYFDRGGTVDVKPIPGLPTEFILHQNYPNPFNPVTNIVFSIPYTARTTLKIYSLLGEEVVILVDEELPVGAYEVPFDGSGLSSGAYIYVLRAKDVVFAKKMILIK